MVDKFLSEEALSESYKNLEKEFTKKCQELSELKKELSKFQESEVEINKVQEDEFCDVVLPLGLEEVNVVEKVERVPEENVVESENQEPEKIEEVKETTQNEYFNLDFRIKASDFLQKTPEAKPYLKEISKILLQDKSLLNCSTPFDVAFAIALKNSKKEVQKTAIEEVDKPIKPTQEPVFIPKVNVLSGGIVGSSPRETKRKFSSISEAGEEILKRYF